MRCHLAHKGHMYKGLASPADRYSGYHDKWAEGLQGPGPWFTLVDAAKACGTHPPDLSQHPADFVVLSFYKIFGYPTGAAGLLVAILRCYILKAWRMATTNSVFLA
eukprot:scaffold648032_cov31-Prasinocladus_malaysianus.AAC.1